VATANPWRSQERRGGIPPGRGLVAQEDGAPTSARNLPQPERPGGGTRSVPEPGREPLEQHGATRLSAARACRARRRRPGPGTGPGRNTAGPEPEPRGDGEPLEKPGAPGRYSARARACRLRRRSAGPGTGPARNIPQPERPGGGTRSVPEPGREPLEHDGATRIGAARLVEHNAEETPTLYLEHWRVRLRLARGVGPGQARTWARGMWVL
jgi:hypothetical protein